MSRTHRLFVQCAVGLMLAAAPGTLGPRTARQSDAPAVHLTSAEDHQRFMDLLHISSMPPPVSADQGHLCDEAAAKPRV